MSYRRALQIFLSLIGLAAALFVQAGTVQKLSLDQLSSEADLIVRGRVETLKSRQASDRRPMSTVVTLAVERQFKGPKVSSVTIEQAGGSQGDVTLGVPGSPEFTHGEDVILFLKRNRDGASKIVGGRQGKFTVKTPLGVDKEVVEDFAHRAESLDIFLGRLTTTIQKSH